MTTKQQGSSKIEMSEADKLRIENEVVAEYRARILCTTPTDYEQAREIATNCYTLLGKPQPKEWFYCKSPTEYLNIAERLANEENRNLSRRQLARCLIVGGVYGNWVAAYDWYCRTTGAAPDTDKLKLAWAVSRMIGVAFGFALFETYGFIVGNPIRLSTWINPSSGLLQLHDTQQAAVKWGDGGSIYAIENFVFGAKVVLDPQSQTIEEITAEENLERRRIMIDQMGWASFLKKADAKVIDKRRNDVDGGTFELLVSTPVFEDRRVLVTTCPTGRLFALMVPPTTETCAAAQRYLVHDEKLVNIGRT
jgi:hypothetical protein